MSTVRIGSSKIMEPAGKGEIFLRYTIGWSAYDRGTSPQMIPGIGAARCACAVKSFELAREAGVPTHFLEQIDPLTILVKEFAVPGHASLSGQTCGRVLDAEWIWRARAAGSLLTRIKAGEIDPVVLGFTPGTEVVEGMKLPYPVQECTTKFESVDRHLTDDETRARIGLDKVQWGRAWKIIMRAVEASNGHYDYVGFDSSDGKCELALTNDDEIVMVDAFGTQDENRITDQETGEIYCKDLIRNHLKKTSWYADLIKAKKEYPGDKSKWPPYHPCPACR